MTGLTWLDSLSAKKWIDLSFNVLIRCLSEAVWC